MIKQKQTNHFRPLILKDPYAYTAYISKMSYSSLQYKKADLIFLWKNYNSKGLYFNHSYNLHELVFFLQSFKIIDRLVMFRDHLKIQVHLLQDFLRSEADFKIFYNSSPSHKQYYVRRHIIFYLIHKTYSILPSEFKWWSSQNTEMHHILLYIKMLEYYKCRLV